MLHRALRPLSSNSRQYASAVASSHSSVTRPEVSSGKLSNGLQIASFENHGPASTLSFVVNASTRYETPENFGVSHFLRLFGFKGVQGRTSLRLVRELDNHGGNLTISSDREKIVYTAEFLRGDLPLVFELLSGVFTSPEYALYELNDVRDRVALDLDQLAQNYDEQVLELLHKAAFRQGLGNSNYAPKVNVSSIKEKTLHEYTKKHFVSGNIAIVGAGVNFHDLETQANSHHLNEIAEGKATPAASKYHGGEVHIGRFCSNARAAVAFPTTPEEKLTSSILKKILGGTSCVTYGGSSSLLSKISGKGKAEAFDFNYSDAGLVGFFVKAPHNSGIQKIVENGLAQIHNLANNVSEADLTRGKNQLKFDYLTALEKRTKVTPIFGKSLLQGKKLATSQGIASEIDKITASDMQKFVTKILKSTPTVIVAADDY